MPIPEWRGSCLNSLRVFLQELDLTWGLNCNSLSRPHALNRYCGTVALGNQIGCQQRAGPANASLAMDRYRTLCGALVDDKTNEFFRLLHCRCAAVGNRQTQKRKASR